MIHVCVLGFINSTHIRYLIINIHQSKGKPFTFRKLICCFSSPNLAVYSWLVSFVIKASGDVNIEGVNVTNSANAQFKAEGSAGAEVSTGATAVLKGSIVQIN